MTHFQRTINKSISFSGVALHSGQTVNVEIRPASANTGILFQRTDLPDQPYIKATPENVFDTRLATRIGTPQAYVSTIEHLMAAFFGLGIDNAVVALNNSEMPILDGSAAPFLVVLDEAGVYELQTPKKVILIKNTIEIVDENNPSRFIRIDPSHEALLSYSIEFAGGLLSQRHTTKYDALSFCKEFSFARTFCMEEEIQFMHARGLAKGGSMQNAVIFSKSTGVINSMGLRDELEFVKHKILDCIGDLALLGAPVLGHVIAHKAGHDLHTKLAKAIALQTHSLVLQPTRSELSKVPGLLDILSQPKSLLDVGLNLARLPVG